LVGFGRMGRMIDGQAAARGHRRVAALGREEVRAGALARERLAGVDVAFEFTRPEVAEANVLALLGAGVPTVCGTTGWRPGPRLADAIAASEAGLVLAANYSPGMELFRRTVEHCARLAGRLGLHEPYVIERHHRGKRDVPSGTARMIAELIAAADPRIDAVLEGHPAGRLPERTVQVVGLRAGAESGMHEVGFDGEQELIVLRHCARGRTGFALGAVLAAEWLGRRRGLHRFDEVMDARLGDPPGPGATHEGEKGDG
jgi:4-hydroxy-tetrahydrodipicolinate reductase